MAGSGSSSTARTASGMAPSSPPSKGTGPVAAATAAIASIWPVTVFVAGTARSGPTPRASTASAAPPSGLSASFTTATVRAPASPSRRHTVTISGVSPDWLIATTRKPS